MHESSENQSNRKDVFVIASRKNGKKKWVRIGAAFVNRDSSINVYLDATPVSGELQIRDYVPWEDRPRSDGARVPFGDAPPVAAYEAPGDLS